MANEQYQQQSVLKRWMKTMYSDMDNGHVGQIGSVIQTYNKRTSKWETHSKRIILPLKSHSQIEKLTMWFGKLEAHRST